MDGGIKDTPISRRELLKKTGKLAIPVAATAVLGTAAFLPDSKTGAGLSTAVTLEPTPAPTPIPEKPKFEDPVESRVKQMKGEDLDIYKSVIKNPIFERCSPLEKLVAFDHVKLQVLQAKGSTEDAYELDAKRVLDKNNINIDLYYQIAIDEITKYKENLNPILKDPAFKDLMLSLIFVESKGDANEIGVSGDMGLCQLLPGTMEGIAKKRGKTITPEVMLDPAVNVRYGIAYLNEQLNNFKDAGIALWTYNMGHGNMVELIEAYFKGDRPDYFDRVSRVIKGEKINEFEKPDPETKTDNRAPLVKIVDHLGLDLVTLLNSRSVSNWLIEAKKRRTNPVGKDTELYATRVAAANYLLNLQRQKGSLASVKKAA
ncbi:MAG: transglycosylase SLT domain-containing protein [Patescibacteria group bacterium]|nr:transglycosylase SLT domain-containing protein [Patescibacteria group bacterium]